MNDHQPPPPRPDDLWGTLGVLGHHWKVVAGGVVLTVVAVAVIAVTVSPVYTARSSLILLGPTAGEEAETSVEPAASTDSTESANPYLGFGASLRLMTEILAQLMATDVVSEAIDESGVAGSYVVSPASGDAPIVSVEVTAATPDEALALQTEVLDELDRQLAGVQGDGGAPPDTYIRSEVLDSAANAQREQGSRVRAVGAVVALGGIVTIVLVFALDSLLRHRRAAGGELAGDAPHDAPRQDPPTRGGSAPARQVSDPANGDRPGGDRPVPSRPARERQDPVLPRPAGASADRGVARRARGTSGLFERSDSTRARS